ncbi:MBL fold metallo-hydrolase [Aliamphritea spongicola]
MLFDTGASYPGGSVAQSFVIPSAGRSGVNKLNWLVVSHGDNDHSGGFADVNRQLKPGEVFLAALNGRRVWKVTAEDTCLRRRKGIAGGRGAVQVCSAG